MVLLTNGHAEPVHLYVERLASQRFRRHRTAFVSVQGVQQADEETARGTHPGARWDIGDTNYLQTRRHFV